LFGSRGALFFLDCAGGALVNAGKAFDTFFLVDFSDAVHHRDCLDGAGFDARFTAGAFFFVNDYHFLLLLGKNDYEFRIRFYGMRALALLITNRHLAHAMMFFKQSGFIFEWKVEESPGFPQT